MKSIQSAVVARFCRGLMVSVAGLAGAAPVLAQGAEPSALALQEGVPQDIVVTARARNESAQQVPISVAVVSGTAIAKSAVVTLADLSARLPSVKITEAAAGDQLFIRGVGSGLNPGFEQSVGTFVDGIYSGRGRQSAGQLLDVERVEVLKGPQSIYFGNNTIGGALNIATRKPGDEVEGFIQGSHEFVADEWDAQGAITLPATEKASLRVAGRYNDLGGWLRNTLLDRDEQQRRSYTFRGTAKLEPNESLTAILKVEHGHLYELGNLYQTVNCPGVRGIAAPPNCSAAVASAASTGFEDSFDRNKQDGSLGPYAAPQFDPANKFHRQNSFDASMNLDWDAGGLTIQSITGYTWYKDYRNNVDNDFTPNDIFVVPRRETYRQFSQELRATSAKGQAIDYVFGVYLQDGHLDLLDQFSTTLAGGASPDTRDVQDQTTLSGFGALTWNIAPALRVTGGVRYSSVKKKDRHSVVFYKLDHATPLTPANALVLNNAFGFFESPEQRFGRRDSDLTPSVSVQWDVAPRVMAYGSYVEGFKAGGYDALLRLRPTNAAAFADAISFDPERAQAWELGIKSRLADGRLLLNVALFRSDYRQLQVSTFDGTAAFLVGNAGRARSQGVDGELRWTPTSRLSLGTTISYLDATYRNFTTAQCRFVNPRINPAAPAACIQSGEPLTYSPKWSGSAFVGYTVPLAGDLELRWDSSVNFTSRFFTAADNDPNTLQTGYAKIDGRIAIGPQGAGWEVALIGKNLTDKLTTGQANDLPLAAGSYFKLTERPRSIAMQLSHRF
jgi:outer membrane receptor protein involved in Fe transport